MDFDKALENSLDECNKLVSEFQITRAQYQELISIGRPGPRDRAFKAHDLVSSPWSAALQVTFGSTALDEGSVPGGQAFDSGYIPKHEEVENALIMHDDNDSSDCIRQMVEIDVNLAFEEPSAPTERTSIPSESPVPKAKRYYTAHQQHINLVEPQLDLVRVVDESKKSFRMDHLPVHMKRDDCYYGAASYTTLAQADYGLFRWAFVDYGQCPKAEECLFRHLLPRGWSHMTSYCSRHCPMGKCTYL